MTTLSEAEIEGVLLDQLLQLGYSCLNDAVSGPDGHAPEREAYSDTILAGRLRDAIARLNPQIPEDAREDALRQVIASDRPSLIEENRRLHRFLVEGVPVEYRAEGGTIRGDAVRLVDPEDGLNDWLAIAQFTVIENGNNRRPDVVVFLNGLPVGVIEVKKPGAENATLGAAFNQLKTYKAQIPSLFRPMQCWLRPMASKPASVRSRRIWNASCLGAQPMALMLHPRVRQKCRSLSRGSLRGRAFCR